VGLFDKVKQGLKDTTGLGLDAEEQYQRAYTNGVLIQRYDKAVEFFEKAIEKCTKENGSPELTSRARANAAIYRLIHSRDKSKISEVIQSLHAVPEIEQIGTDKELVAPDTWIAELKALQLEHAAEGTQDLIERRTAYSQASDLLMGIGPRELTFVEKLGFEGPKDKASLRAFYCGAQSDYNAALVDMLTSPTQAEDHLHKAGLRFRQAQATTWADQVDAIRENVQTKRHCYICNREMQGKGIFFDYYPATVENYNKSVLKNLNHDMAMVDTDNHVTLCTVCGSTIEREADKYATERMNELREWVTPILEKHQEWLANHESRIDRLESLAHRH
jgi:hypothetical protein